MTDDPDAGSTGLALGAGALVLGAVPVFFALLETIPGETFGSHPYIRELLAEAGPAGIVVVVAGLVATLGAAAITGVSAPAPTPPGR